MSYHHSDKIPKTVKYRLVRQRRKSAGGYNCYVPNGWINVMFRTKSGQWRRIYRYYNEEQAIKHLERLLKVEQEENNPTS